MAHKLHTHPRVQQWRIRPGESPSIEISLLLACARSQISDEHRQEIRHLLSQAIDWPIVQQLAKQHGTLPLLYQGLKQAGADLIEDHVLAELRNYSQGIAFQNSVFTRALLNILNLFAANDILALPFKGPVLAASAYKNISLRSFCDLDILIRQEDCLKAVEVLVIQGNYRTNREWHFLNESWEQLYRRSYREVSLTNGIVTIDLHQELTVERYLSTQFSFDELWQHHDSVEIAAQQVPNFATIDVLLYLCVHASKECWRKLKWICDITEFVQVHPELNWQVLFERAQVLNCERRLLTGLLLSQTLLSLSFPDRVWQRADQDKVCYELASEFSQRLFWDKNHLDRQFTVEKFLLHLKSLEKRSDQLQSREELMRQSATTVIKLLPNSEDAKFVQLPQYLHFLYYLIRPCRLLLEKAGVTRQ